MGDKTLMRSICRISECGRVVVGRGLCDKHYQGWKNGKLDIEASRVYKDHQPGEPRVVNKGKECSVIGCSRKAHSRELCHAHYKRRYLKTPLENLIPPRKGWGWHKGYKVLPNGKYEHRDIIEKALGKRLRYDDTVHHKNGIKSDNRLENLQVMSRSEHTALHHQEQKALDTKKGA